MSTVGSLHAHLVFKRRVEVLCRELVAAIPEGARVLDVGAGDGLLAARLSRLRPDLSFTAIDVLVRPVTHVPVSEFDGKTIPYEDGAFDTVLFVDVLHHADCGAMLLAEAARVSRRSIVIKDHTVQGWFAGPTLRFMDVVGNGHHGVSLPFNYWSLGQWHRVFAELGLSVAYWEGRLRLYPRPFRWLFDRSLHFVARLEKAELVR